MPDASKARHILIGTAGHIDHGKTRLVGQLTNINTDRLPEEKARGISIDLGFAHWEAGGFRFGVVDVPGHERFVKNMVAGATGVNVALLVIAADDSVMPQTREHLEIMDLLAINTGAVAITKTDLVDEEMVELVQDEIEETVAGTFLEGCPVVPVSSETGAGIDQLKATLLEIAETVETVESHELFRMPIDRVFSITGHGTVVTGSVASGEVAAGEILEMLPEGREVRVRSVQSHGTQNDDAGARQRTAINLAGVKNEEIARGHELATPGYLKSTMRMVVELRSLSSSPIVLKDRLELNLHLGTCEVPVRIILKGRQLKAGERCYAELRAKQPFVATYGQRFILRRISPAITVAGGTVLDPYIPPHKRIKDLQAYGVALDTTSEAERLSALLIQADTVGDSPHEATWRVGISSKKYEELIDSLKQQKLLMHIGSKDRRMLIHRKRLKSLAGSVMKTIKEELARHQPRRALPRNTLNTACREIAAPGLLDAVFAYLITKSELVQIGSNLGPADGQVKLTKNQQQARTQSLEAITQSGLKPPTLKELAASTGQKPAEIETLLNLSVEDGLLVKIADGLFFTPEAIEQARGMCENVLNELGEATMSQLREAWGVSRKFAVPICEHLDQLQVTTRTGDVRIAGPRIKDTIIQVP